MPSTICPAVKRYWFGKAYRDLLATTKDAHDRNRQCALQHWDAAARSNWLLAAVRGSAAVTVVVAGTVTWGMLLPIHLAFISSLALLQTSAYVLMDLAERCYLLYKGWSTVCRHCGEQVTLPEYQCPQCRAWHPRLRPSPYGTRKHRCRCGQALPCTFLSSRHKLAARCPHAHCRQPLTAEVDTRSTSAVIALIGPPNSGKTGFLVAAVDVMVHRIAGQRAFQHRFPDHTSDEFLQDERESIALAGTTRKTAHDKPPALSILFQSRDKRIRHQVFFFDAAGETFLSTDRMRSQYHFRHLTGGVILVDPFSLPGVQQQYRAALTNAGLDRMIASEAAIDVVDRFLLGMQRHFGLHQEALLEQPYAVVVTKTDLCGLHELMQPKSLPTEATQVQQRRISSDHVRRQLVLWGATALVAQLEARFSRIMYFAAAPIQLTTSGTGHQARLAKVGVAAPLLWMLESTSDPLAS